MLKKLLKSVLVLAALSLALLALYLSSKTPETTRDWLPEQAETATVTREGDMVTIHNLRDWTYDAERPLETTWTSKTINPDDIERTWFIIEPFADWKAVGHTFLSFELTSGEVISFSVEARREQGEEYKATKGLVREYELSYQWGTERDFVTRRLIYLNHPLRLYPMTLSKEDSRALFLSLTEETNVLAEHPRFYNTLTANCTNILAKIVNKHYPGTLPYDLSWNFTGYADLYLFKEGLIAQTGTPEETQARADLTPHRDEVVSFSTSPHTTFSTKLRALILSSGL